MFRSIFAFILLSFPISLFSQTVIFEDNFDTYTTGQGTANQSPVWQSWASPNGGSDDALVSDEHALSGNNSMKMINGKDMVYPFNNISTGAFTIEFNAYMHDQGYFNLQHSKGTNWAVDIYLTDNNEIKYLEENGIANSIVVGTYQNDQWTHFKFTIDLDLDTILFHVDGVLLHASKFSNSLDMMPSDNLDIMNFYGLAGFNGVSSSYYYVDDFKVTQLTSSSGVMEGKITDGITIFPNPAKELLTINSDDNIERLVLFDVSGKKMAEYHLHGKNTQIPLPNVAPGVYWIEIKSEDNTYIKKILIQ